MARTPLSFNCRITGNELQVFTPLLLTRRIYSHRMDTTQMMERASSGPRAESAQTISLLRSMDSLMATAGCDSWMLDSHSIRMRSRAPDPTTEQARLICQLVASTFEYPRWELS